MPPRSHGDPKKIFFELPGYENLMKDKNLKISCRKCWFGHIKHFSLEIQNGCLINRKNSQIECSLIFSQSMDQGYSFDTPLNIILQKDLSK